MSHSVPIPPFNITLDTLNYLFSSLCIIVDAVFLCMLYTDKSKKNEKKNFILTSIIHLILCNLLRSIFFVIVHASTYLSYHVFYLCSVLSVPYQTFRIGEHFWSTALAYALFYKLKSKTVDSGTPGDKYLPYLIWIISVTLSIIGSAVGTNISIHAVYPSYSLCSFSLHVLFVQISYWTTCFINSIILIVIVYYARNITGRSIPYTFYLIMFLSFEFLRLPYFSYQLNGIVTNDVKASYALRPDFQFFLCIFLSTGAFTSALFSYNFGYFSTCFSYCKNFKKI